MSAILRTVGAVLGLSIAAACAAAADEEIGASAGDDKTVQAARLAFFESNIRPVLVDTATSVIRPSSGPRKETCGSIRARRFAAAATAGRPSSPASPKASLLLTAVSHADPDLKMPPKRERADRARHRRPTTWIKTGAADPREATGECGGRPGHGLREGRQFWAFRKPVDHPAPTDARPAWARRNLDHFILAKLEAAGLAPSPDAEPATLLRRLHFDLVGPAPVARGRLNSLPSSRPSRRPDSTVAAEAIVDRCSPRRSSASVGAGTGSTWPGSPSRAARKRTSPSRTPGGIATTSSTPSTPTCRSTASSPSRSPATCCRPTTTPSGPGC